MFNVLSPQRVGCATIAPASYYTSVPVSAHGNCSRRQRKHDTRSTSRSRVSLLHAPTSAHTITGPHKTTVTHTNLPNNAYIVCKYVQVSIKITAGDNIVDTLA